MKLLVAVTLSLAWCDPPPPKPLPVASCAASCENLRRHNCPEAQPTDAGDSCEAVCENTLESPAPLPTTCVARAESCDQAARCE